MNPLFQLPTIFFGLFGCFKKKQQFHEEYIVRSLLGLDQMRNHLMHMLEICNFRAFPWLVLICDEVRTVQAWMKLLRR